MVVSVDEHLPNHEPSKPQQDHYYHKARACLFFKGGCCSLLVDKIKEYTQVLPEEKDQRSHE